MATPGKPSTFVWYDVMTQDADATEKFYTQLFGWTINPVDMGPMGTYRMFVNDGAPFGGIMAEPSMEHPPHWMGYLYTNDVDNTVARTEAMHGKRFVGPMDIPNVGRFAVVSDPQGAFFSWFQPSETSTGPSARHTEKGDLGWGELMTTDLAGAKAFYSELAGWDVSQAMDMGEGGEYIMAMAGEEGVAGLMQRNDMPVAAWMHYVNVASTDDAVARALELGATICVPPTDVPGMVRFSMLNDPTGAMFGVVQSLRAA